MARWSPSVLPEAPRAVTYDAIGDALFAMRGMNDRARDRSYRRERDEVEDARYAERTATEATRYADEQARLTARDARDAEAHALRTEGDALVNRDRARDLGYVDDATATQRRTTAETMRAGGDALGGPMGGASAMLGDALLEAMQSRPSMTLTAPGGARETMTFDPTQTREARTESAALRAEQRRLAAQRAEAERKTIADRAQTTFETDEDIRLARAKAALEPRGGGSGGPSIDKALAAQVKLADARVDATRTRLHALEPKAPRSPDYSTFGGMAAPVPGQADYPAFQADSVQRAKRFATDSAAHATKLNAAAKDFEYWSGIADSLSREAMGLTGGEAIGGSQQVQAAAEQQRLAAELNAQLPAVAGDPVAERELRQRFAELSRSINEKYGLTRRRPED